MVLSIEVKLLYVLVGLFVFGKVDAVAPIGIFLGAEPNFRLKTDQEFRKFVQHLKLLGFNTVVTGANCRMVEIANDEHFQIISYLPDDLEKLDFVRLGEIECMDRNPALSAWYFSDEPDRLGKISEASKRYETIKALGIQKPLALSLYVPKLYSQTSGLGDVVMPDPYIFGYRKKDGSSYTVSEIVDRLRSLKGLLREDQQMWTIPQLYAWYPYFRRPPTAEENLAQTIIAIAEGSTGLVYFSWNSGAYFDHEPNFEPVFQGESPRNWELEKSADLLASVSSVNCIAKKLFTYKCGKAISSQDKVLYEFTKDIYKVVVEISYLPLKVKFLETSLDTEQCRLDNF